MPNPVTPSPLDPGAAEFSYRVRDGSMQTGQVRVEDYETAARHNLRLSQLINARYPNYDPEFGTTYEQALVTSGVFTRNDPERGIRASLLQSCMNGESQLATHPLYASDGGMIVAPAGPRGGSTPASRLFLPEVFMQMAEETLFENWGPELAAFPRLLANDTQIVGPVYTQPLINTRAPESVGSRQISQNAMPPVMLSITASQSSQTIADNSIGLEISDQAARLSTLDLVSIIVRRQMEGESLRLLWRDLRMIVDGNITAGESPLSPVPFTDYDPDAPAGKLTQDGLIKVLWKPERTVRYDVMIGRVSDYLAIERREGRPLMFDPNTGTVNRGNAGSYGKDVSVASPINFAELGLPFILLIPDNLWPANQILFMDSRYGLRRVTNILSEYRAVQEMVLQRSQFYRWDWGYKIHRLGFDEAFLLLDYN